MRSRSLFLISDEHDSSRPPNSVSELFLEWMASTGATQVSSSRPNNQSTAERCAIWRNSSGMGGLTAREVRETACRSNLTPPALVNRAWHVAGSGCAVSRRRSYRGPGITPRCVRYTHTPVACNSGQHRGRHASRWSCVRRGLELKVNCVSIIESFPDYEKLMRATLQYDRNLCWLSYIQTPPKK